MYSEMNRDFFSPEVNMRWKEIRGPIYATSEI